MDDPGPLALALRVALLRDEVDREHPDVPEVGADRPARPLVLAHRHPPHADAVGAQEEDEHGGQDPVEHVDARAGRQAVPALAGGQEGALAVVDADVAAAEPEPGGQEADAGEQRHDDDRRELGLPGAVEEARDARQVVARREPAAQAHHGLAGLGVARAVVGALAAVVAEPGVEARSRACSRGPSAAGASGVAGRPCRPSRRGRSRSSCRSGSTSTRPGPRTSRARRSAWG